MRSVVNISLPWELRREVEKTVSRERFATVSEFFRYLLRLWFEGRLANELNKSHEELKSGQGRRLRSLKDLR